MSSQSRNFIPCLRYLFPKRCGRFTLVEMLIVITIIAVLAALLLPALQKGVLQARKASCINQMRQCGMELIMYCEKYYDRAPFYYNWGDKQNTSAVWMVNGAGGPSLAGFTALGKLYYDGFMRSPLTYYCPTKTNFKFNNREWPLTSNYHQWPPGRWGESFCPPSGGAWANCPTYLSYGTRPVTGAPSSFKNWINDEWSSTPRWKKYAAKAVLADGFSLSNISGSHVDGANILRGDGSGRFVRLDSFYLNLTKTSPDILTVGSAKDSGVWADFDCAR